jgi:hypothetical protein
MKSLAWKGSGFLLLLLTLLTIGTAQSGRKRNAETETLEQKLKLEKQRVQGDLRIREEELKLRRDELKAKQESERNQSFSSLTYVSGTILVGLVSLLGTAVVALIQARSNYRTQTELERTKFESDLQLAKRKLESDLIVKVIQTGNVTSSRKNLEFLV